MVMHSHSILALVCKDFRGWGFQLQRMGKAFLLQVFGQNICSVSGSGFIFQISFLFFLFFLCFLLYFKFQGTCAQHAGLLHMYTCAMLVCWTHQLVSTHQLVIYISYNPQCHSSPLHSPHKRPWWVMFPFLCPSVLIVQFPPMNENMQCFVFCPCESLLGMMVFSCIHVPTKDMNSSFFMAAQYSMVYMCHIFLIQSITDGHLCWFQIFAIVTSATVNISVHGSLQ